MSSSPAAICSRAHPRSRGENATHPDEVMNALGSSPLTRGKLDELGLVAAHAGLIPAHAGKTVFSFVELQGAWAHPRSRGENTGAGCRGRRGWGSSPLTRGKLPRAGFVLVDNGLIPAHAGKTRSPWTRTTRVRAHPRSRGENPFSTSMAGRGMGSSPLTRGKHCA